MEKIFTSIEDQIALLERRGLICDERTADVLLREGYYPVINGYRRPFLDRHKTDAAGESVYREGTRFSDIYRLFLFDRKLRQLTFVYLTQIEALLRNTCAYRFTGRYRGIKDYLKKSSYTSKKDYLGGADDFESDLKGLISTLEYASRREDADKAGVRHYIKHYDGVPLWVLVGEFTFGNVRHFFNMLERDIQVQICDDIARLCHPEVDDKRFITRSWLSRNMKTLVEARNICAHDDRLFNHYYDEEGRVGYKQLLDIMDRLLTPAEIAERDAQIHALAEDYLEDIPQVHELVTGWLD